MREYKLFLVGRKNFKGVEQLSDTVVHDFTHQNIFPAQPSLLLQFH